MSTHNPMGTRRLTTNHYADRSQVATMSPDSRAFHESLPGYEVTPLRFAPTAAQRLGVRSVWVKDESNRLGMPSFKILGASWAAFRVLRGLLGVEVSTLPQLREALAESGRQLTLVAATDGNHGRAVARIAAILGLGGHIVVPADMVAERIAAIEGEGATVQVVDGGYDEAIITSAALADETHIVISDTSWEGYTQPPAWVIDGYSTMMTEIIEAIERREIPEPTVVVGQIGVGSFAASVAQGFAGRPARRLLGVEPTKADCVTVSIERGRVVTIPGPQESIMAGLNCGTPSLVAWPDVSRGFDHFATATDEDAEEAMRLLYADGIISGESGAAGLAGLLAHGREYGLSEDDDVLLFSTEGATGVENFNRITGAQLS